MHLCCSKNKLANITNMFQSSINALANAVNPSAAQQGTSFPDTDTVFALCQDAEAQYPAHGGPGFWRNINCEISKAMNDMAFVRNSLEVKYTVIGGSRNQQHELELLCALSQSCVHIGAILTQLLQPSSMDPISMSETQCKCYLMLVSTLLRKEYVYISSVIPPRLINNMQHWRHAIDTTSQLLANAYPS